mgnify:CR=1 FL=1
MLALAALSLLAGCASTDGISSSARPLSAADLGLSQTDAAPLAADWWTAWGDDSLSGLIEQALQSQPSLKVAQARLDRAQAAVAGEQAADGLHVNASADTTRQHFSATSIYPAPLGGSIRTLANAQVAAQWEFDFFGRHRAALDAALGQTRAAQADLQAAGCAVHLIGGADLAAELDAKRAILQGTQLALSLGSDLASTPTAA